MKGNGILLGTQAIGCKVENAAGEYLGTVANLVLDYLQGRVAFVILAPSKSIVRVSDSHLPLPMAALSYRPSEHVFVLHVDSNTLEKAPRVSGRNLEVLGDRQEAEKVFSYYGYAPYWE